MDEKRIPPILAPRVSPLSLVGRTRGTDCKLVAAPAPDMIRAGRDVVRTLDKRKRREADASRRKSQR